MIELLNSEDFLHLYDAKDRKIARYAANKSYHTWSTDHYVKFRKLGLKDFDFVHGSYEDLLKGKVCIVREGFAYFKSTGDKVSSILEDYDDTDIWRDAEKTRFYLGNPVYDIVEGYTFKTTPYDEGKLLIIGRTASGNTKIKLFRK
ncbi:MAG: hypothetical protein ACKOWO_03215 [Sediminibacterium sp.]